MSDIIKLAREILILSRNTLLVNLRFLDKALSQFQMELGWFGVATDGSHLYYDPEYVLKRFRESKEEMTRDYLHIVFHCVFRHMFIGNLVDKRLWNLACDIAVESVIGELGLKTVTTKQESKQQDVINSLLKKVSSLTAEKIYRYLLDEKMPDSKLEKWEDIFYRDAHSFWYLEADKDSFINTASSSDNDSSSDKNKDDDFEGENESQSQSNSSNQGDEDNIESDKENSGKNPSREGTPGEKKNQREKERESSETDSQKNNKVQNSSSSTRKELEQTWKDISERMQQEMETFAKQQGDFARNMMQNLREINRERYDYTAFLKKFAVNTEVIKINDDEFDYIFYTYGLNLYERMPLIEPLEYKEAKRIREFVIAIDTSGSVQGEVVQKFIQKTYNILKSVETFASKINLHILQCDDYIQEHVKITCQEEFDEYLQTMQIKGLGGTDFRPVFELTDKLIKDKEFKNLKGLIYFTDGLGKFPRKKPEYETAFVFIDDDLNNYSVPPWAIKIILKSEEI